MKFAFVDTKYTSHFSGLEPEPLAGTKEIVHVDQRHLRPAFARRPRDLPGLRYRRDQGCRYPQWQDRSRAPRDLLLAIARLDLLDWRQALVFALILLGAPGSRPSHVRSRFHGKGDAGDVAALRQTIRRNPLPFLAFIAIVYGAFFAAREWFPSVYWHPMEAVWAVALTGIVLALFGAAFWGLAGLDSRASAAVAWLGPTTFVLVQVAGRVAAPSLSILELNGVSVAAWLVVALVLAQVLPRR
jgi:hypothetical protein